MRSTTRLLLLLFSPSQMLMTASRSHVKMEALASTRLIHSSAFACRAMEETRVRKVRGRQTENTAHIQMGLRERSYHALFVHTV